MKNLGRVVLASFGLLFASCAGPKATTNPTPGLLNSKCVVSGEALDASSPTMDFMGGKVGFCCDKCCDRWKGMSEDAKKSALQANK